MAPGGHWLGYKDIKLEPDACKAIKRRIGTCINYDKFAQVVPYIGCDAVT